MTAIASLLSRDDPDLASYLRIEERELEAGNFAESRYYLVRPGDQDGEAFSVGVRVSCRRPLPSAFTT